MLDDLSFQCDILMPIEASLRSVEFIAGCMEEDPAYGTPSTRLAVPREIARLREVIRVVKGARR